MIKIDSRFKNTDILSNNVKWVSAKSLVTSDRLDIAIKAEFARSVIDGSSNLNIYDVYRRQLGIITNGTFFEEGDTEKSSYDDYHNEFIKLINSLMCGYDERCGVIPVSKSGVPLDGAHRIAIASVLGLDVPIISLARNSLVYDVDYFKSRFTETKEIERYLLSWIEESDDTIGLVIEWPTGKGLRKNIEQSYGRNIVYMKEYAASYEVIKNLMLMSYWNETWLGGDEVNNYGINSKARECFGNELTRFYWIKGLSRDTIVDIKGQIRELVGSSKHSLHSTETRNETLILSRSLLHENSMSMLGRIRPELYSKYLRKLINSVDVRDVNRAVSGSAVLGLFGIREPSDIDYIIDANEIADCHNDFLNMYGLDSIQDIYTDDNFFFYFGIKFLDPALILKMKIARNEIKDKIDVDRLRDVLSNNSQAKKNHVRFFYLKFMQRLTIILIRIIKFVGLKRPVKKILDIYFRKIRK